MTKEVSMIILKDSKGNKYKVTRRVPELLISDTKIFRKKESAKKQLDEWLK